MKGIDAAGWACLGLTSISFAIACFCWDKPEKEKDESQLSMTPEEKVLEVELGATQLELPSLSESASEREVGRLNESVCEPKQDKSGKV